MKIEFAKKDINILNNIVDVLEPQHQLYFCIRNDPEIYNNFEKDDEILYYINTIEYICDTSALIINLKLNLP